MEPVQVELMDLPDEMVVEIFSYVEDMKQVLRLRAVCRRWRDLLLHPDVWRHRSIDGDSSDVEVDAALTLVPCLGTMDLIGDDIAVMHRAALVATTKCAVRHLDCYGLRKHGVAITALAIRNQVALGRLRRVDLGAHSPPEPLPSDYCVLLRTLCEAEGLTAMDLDMYCKGRSDHVTKPGSARAAISVAAFFPVVPAADAKASLKTFVSAKWLPDEFVEYVLRCHAPTLECVDVHCVRPDLGVPVATLLSEAPHLRKLTCTLMPGMAQLQKCPLLRKLVLHLSAPLTSGGLLGGAKAFLRELTKLEKVKLMLEFPKWSDEAARDVVNAVTDLVAALAASSCFKITSVSVVRYESGGNLDPVPPALVDALFDALVDALAGLPHLQLKKVKVFGTSADLLGTISLL